ncbi:MAG: hypothetical protein ACKVU1_18600 [bacterium]
MAAATQSKPDPSATHPLADRRYLKRGPALPYRGTELLLVLLDLAVIFFGVKGVESFHAHRKGDRLISEAKTEEAAARKAEAEMIAFRTGRRDSLDVAKKGVLEARHADSLRIADLDTLVVLVVEDIEGVRAEYSRVVGRSSEATAKKSAALKDRNKAAAKLPGVQTEIELALLRREAFEDSIRTEWPKIAEAEHAYQVALSERPEVVVPQTSSASVGTQVASGDLFATVGLGRTFFNVGRGQFGLSGLAGFGANRTSVSGGGLFFNVPVFSQRASLDIGSGATVSVEEDGASSASPYLSGSLRYSLSKDKRLFFLGDSRVDRDRVWTGVGIGLGRR